MLSTESTQTLALIEFEALWLMATSQKARIFIIKTEETTEQ